MKHLTFILAILYSHFCRADIDLKDSVNCLLPPTARLAAQKNIIEPVLAYNRAYQDIAAIEQKWASLKEDDPLITQVTQNPTAKILRHYVNKISLNGEAFVIGKNGGLVAATNKTSDFYQGDEAQFIKGIALEAGIAKVINILPDKSAGTIVVKIVSPIISSDNGKAIGVLIMGYDAVVLDFKRICKK